MTQTSTTRPFSAGSRALRAVTLLALMLAGTALSGCSKCGFFWEEGNRPAACRTGTGQQ